MRKLFPALFILLLVCCRQHSPQQIEESFKDSVVKKYITLIDSMKFYDTFNRDFRILKAYFKNDTYFFSRLKEDIHQSQQDAIFYNRDDSCIIQKTLSDLKADKAYRFKHWEAFCPFRQNITITLTDKKAMLHYIEYSNGEGNTLTMIRPGGDTFVVKPYCTMTREFDKPLSMNDWEEFEKKVRDADYWGMKEKGGGGLDGSIWQIDALVNEKNKSFNIQNSHSVWRHNNFSKCFEYLGRYMLKLSGEKTMCGNIN